VFADTSVLLAASLSRTGAARAVLRAGKQRGWSFHTGRWCLAEVARNLSAKYPSALPAWRGLRSRVRPAPDWLVLDKPLVFPVTKDRPVLVTALALRADVLLTFDRADFQDRLGTEVYGMRILTPGELLSSL